MRNLSRTLLLLTGTALALPAAAGAQALEIGVWGGYTRSNQVTTDVTICTVDGCQPTSMRPHFQRNAQTLGGMLRREINGLIALRGDLALAQKGFGPGDERSDQLAHSSYIELPLLVEIRPLRAGSARLQLAAGLAPALLISCDAVGTTTAGASGKCGGGDPSENGGPTRDYDVGWVIAPGFGLSLPDGDLLLELRHVRGLVNIRPEANGTTLNRSTSVSLAYAWRLR